MGFLDVGILALTCFVDVYFIHDFFSTYFEVRYFFAEKRYIIYLAIVVTSSLCLLANIYGNRELNLCFTVLLLFIYTNVIFEGELRDKTFKFILIYIIMVGCEILIGTLTRIDSEGYKSLSIAPQIEIMVLLLTYIILQIVKRSGKQIKEPVPFKFLCSFLVIPISCLFLMLAVYYSYTHYIEVESPQVLIIVVYTFILLGNLWIYYYFCEYFAKVEENNFKERTILKQRSELQYYKGVSESIDEYSEYIHNTRQLHESLQVLLNEGAYSEAKELLENIVETSIIGAIKEYSNNKTLNLILTDKESKAKKQGVQMNIYVEPNINADMVSEMDLIIMIGNLLENAIEASSKCAVEKKVDVWMYMHNNGNFFVAKVVNNYTGEIKRDGDRFLSNKEDMKNHGKGIWSVNKNAEKYGGYLSSDYDTTTFRSVLLLSTLNVVK